MQAIANSKYVQQVLARQLPFEWATVQMVSDDPAKGLGRATNNELMWTRLKKVIQPPKLEPELVSPYFISGKEGVEIFEMKPEFSPAPTKAHGPLGSSSASLHAKTFSVDRSRAFVGSFNFDPRSQRLNTELGFVIDSPNMAQAIADAFAAIIPARAYSVRLNDAAALQWVEQRHDDEIAYDQVPRTGFWLRAFVVVLSVLPIEWLL